MHRILMIIPASGLPFYTQKAVEYDPIGGAETWDVGLSPTGTQPPTHYWASVPVDDAHLAAFQQIAAADPEAHLDEYDLDADPEFPWRKLTALGLKVCGA